MSLRFSGLSYTYPCAKVPAVRGVTGEVRPGERVLLTGPSGCGKSTLLRLAAGLLQRFGRGQVAGTIEVGNDDPGSLTPAERVRRVAFCSQDPSDQLVTGTVGDEIAFAPESAGWDPARIDAQVLRALEQVGLDVALDRSPLALSGGQQQRLVVAASLSADAPVLLLDEPLAQLDPAAALALLDRLSALAAAGVAILLVEHRLDPCWPWCDQVWLMDEGAVLSQTPPQAVAPETLRALGLRVPQLVALEARLVEAGHSLAEHGIDPVRGGGLLDTPVPGEPAETAGAERSPKRPSEADLVLAAPALTWAWEETVVLAGVTLEATTGERIAILGGNGAGKSTLLAALAGDIEAGEVHVEGRVVSVPQDPDLSLFSESVREELAYGPLEAGRSSTEVSAVVAQVAEALHLGQLLDSSPHALSRGQRLRVAVGAALACAPRVLLLDEPTAGQDHAHVEAVLTALGTGLADAVLLFATHDVGLALRHATRVLVLHEGRLVDDGRPEHVLHRISDELPLVLSPRARLCRRLGLPLLDLDALAARWR